MTPIEKLKKLSKLVCEKCFTLQKIPTEYLSHTSYWSYTVCQSCPIHQLINELTEEIK